MIVSEGIYTVELTWDATRPVGARWVVRCTIVVPPATEQAYRTRREAVRAIEEQWAIRAERWG